METFIAPPQEFTEQVPLSEAEPTEVEQLLASFEQILELAATPEGKTALLAAGAPDILLAQLEGGETSLTTIETSLGKIAHSSL